MGLINLQTDLKSLKYGKDRKGGGDSNQPYIVKDIPPNTDELDNPFKYGTGGPDMLLRGGLLTPLKVVDDVVRFSKFFTDFKTPNGLLFIVQQNLLSRLAVETEASYGIGYGGGSAPNNEKILRGGFFKEGIYTPLSTLGQAAGNAFGLHLNKQGLDPTGLIPNFRIRRYESLFRTSDGDPAVIGLEKNNNRLVKLHKQKILYTLDSGDTNDNILYRYGGGPGSILGIGNTRINLISLEQRTSAAAFKARLDLNGNFTDVFGDEFLRATKYSLNNSYLTPNNLVPERYTLVKDFGSSTLSISNAYNKIANNNVTPQLKVSSFKKNNSSESPIYNGKKLDRSIGEKSIEADNYITSDSGINEDIIDFIIEVITPSSRNNETYYFPAYIESLDDGFTVDWRSEKFMGRGEDFYTYNGFSRDMNITFKTYARNPVAMSAMYNNLQKITAALTPTYSTLGFMQGNIFRLTVGNYLKNNPVVITSFKINEIISENINWEINNNFAIPYILTINMQFKPLYEFVPSINNPIFIPGETQNIINTVSDFFINESKVTDSNISLSPNTNLNPFSINEDLNINSFEQYG